MSWSWVLNEKGVTNIVMFRLCVDHLNRVSIDRRIKQSKMDEGLGIKFLWDLGGSWGCICVLINASSYMYFRCMVGINPERGNEAGVNSGGDGNLISSLLSFTGKTLTMKTFCYVMDILIPWSVGCVKCVTGQWTFLGIHFHKMQWLRGLCIPKYMDVSYIVSEFSLCRPSNL